MNNSEYYVNNNKYSYCMPPIRDRISPCLRRDSYLSEFWSKEEKKLARDNLGITEIIDELRNLIMNNCMGNCVDYKTLTCILKDYCLKQDLNEATIKEWVNEASGSIAETIINIIKNEDDFVTKEDLEDLGELEERLDTLEEKLDTLEDNLHDAPVNEWNSDREDVAMTQYAAKLYTDAAVNNLNSSIRNLNLAIGVPYDNTNGNISNRIKELERNLINPNSIAQSNTLNPELTDLVTVGYLNNEVEDLNNRIGSLSASSNDAILNFGQTKTIAKVLGTNIKVTMPDIPEDNDTKNTTGTGNNITDKLFVVGAIRQDENGVTTNTNSNVYIENNKLYVGNNEVITSDNILGLLNMLALAEALEPYLENELQSIRWESTSGNSVEDSEPHIDVLLIGDYSKGDDSLTLRPTDIRIYTNPACTTLAQSNWYETPGTYYIKGVYTNSNLEEFVTEDYLTWTINQASVISIEVEGGRFDKDVIYTSGNDNTATYIPGTVYGIYNNGTRSVVSATSTLTSLNTSKATTDGKVVTGRQSGEVTIKVRYLYNGTIEETINYPIEVKEKVLESIEWESSYYNGKVGTNLPLSRIKLIYNNEDIAYVYSNASEVILYTDPECTLEFDSTQPGTYHIYAKYRNLITTNDLNVTLNEEPTYAVNFIVDGAQYSFSSGITGTNVTVPSDPNKTGYTFIGWNTNQNATTSSNVVTEIGTSDITYYAIWQIKTYTVTLEITNGTTSSTNPQTVTYRNKASWTVSANSGYKLPEIAYNGIISGNLVLSNIVTSNISVQLACIQLNSYTITWNINGGNGNILPTSVQEGQAINTPLENPSREGYEFRGWATTSDAAEANVINNVTIPTGDTTYYAVWSPLGTYTITWNGNGATTNPNPTSSQVNEEDIPTLPTDPKKEYTLTFNGSNATRKYSYTLKSGDSKWNSKADGTGSNIVAATADTTYYAQWNSGSWNDNTFPSITNLTMNWNLNGGKNGTSTLNLTTTVKGYYYNNNSSFVEANKVTTLPTSISSEITYYLHYDNIVLPELIPTREGYTFKGWATSASATTPDVNNTLNYTLGQTFYAVWEELEPTITNYLYIGTTKPTSLSEAQVVNEYPTEQIYTNNSGTKSKIYVLTNDDKTVEFYNPQFNTELGQVEVDIITIPGYKIFETEGRTGNTGTIKIVIN